MKVYAPVEDFTGTVANVEFADGVGESDDANALNYFRRHGYGMGKKVEAPAPEGDEEKGKAAKKAVKKSAPAKKAAGARSAAPAPEGDEEKDGDEADESADEQ
ncbi:MAG TPA: hypothetical protein VFK41_03050 [Nocardioidaceae bacterium]|nr:hypothetical protein [Nocardioidaceae bacterium]